MPRSLDRDLLNGAAGIEGYVADAAAEQIMNWLTKERGEDVAQVLCPVLRDVCQTVAVIHNLWVDEEYRGHGYGSDLLDKAMEYAGADAILLVCDISATQNIGFFLREFYEGRDFEVVHDTGSWPLMVWPPSVAEALRTALVTLSATV